MVLPVTALAGALLLVHCARKKAAPVRVVGACAHHDTANACRVQVIVADAAALEVSPDVDPSFT